MDTKTLFYDYIYIKALMQHFEQSSIRIDYNLFTDIELIYSHMLRTGTVDKHMGLMENFEK